MTLMDLDVAGRRVLIAGTGPVGMRRARRFVESGADLVLVDPSPSRDASQMAMHGDVQLIDEPVRPLHVDDAWLVVAATNFPIVNAKVTRWCDARRIWCVNATDGTAGSARTAASVDRAGLRIGAVNIGTPDPMRAVAARDALSDFVSDGMIDLRDRRPSHGKVILVGSGPGNDGLMTTAGRDALISADVVVTDRLGATGLLDQLPDDVNVINVGKSPSNHPIPQPDINSLLIKLAQSGRTVVRLKGGDPYIFGRGGEEVAACRAAGITVKVIPGVTSALSVPALAGIPITQRGVTGSALITSGHGGLDPTAISAMTGGATVIMLMGVSALADTCHDAVTHGVDPELPVAIIERGSTSSQRITRAVVATAGQIAAQRKVKAPAVIVFGVVAAENFLDHPICRTSSTAVS